ncbi:hypothetical protein F9C11_34710 [Amycolatopsis sp. VS8301801F10]|uniref:hypothetical protein n=1 Tax=Amycolatopsis sp. VS8301801F10 TaxID=2652442 RepID=UPI0038FD08FB
MAIAFGDQAGPRGQSRQYFPALRRVERQAEFADQVGGLVGDVHVSEVPVVLAQQGAQRAGLALPRAVPQEQQGRAVTRAPSRK